MGKEGIVNMGSFSDILFDRGSGWPLIFWTGEAEMDRVV